MTPENEKFVYVMVLFNHNEDIQNQAQFLKFWILINGSTSFLLQQSSHPLVYYSHHLWENDLKYGLIFLESGIWIQNKIPYPHALVYILPDVRVIKWQSVSQVWVIRVFYLTLKVNKKNGLESL